MPQTLPLTLTLTLPLTRSLALTQTRTLTLTLTLTLALTWRAAALYRLCDDFAVDHRHCLGPILNDGASSTPYPLTLTPYLFANVTLTLRNYPPTHICNPTHPS